MIEVKGHGGQVQFDGQYVTITRKGFLARATVGKGEKRLHISQITVTKQQQPEFEKLRAALDQAIAAQHAPQVPTVAGAASVADESGTGRTSPEQSSGEREPPGRSRHGAFTHCHPKHRYQFE